MLESPRAAHLQVLRTGSVVGLALRLPIPSASEELLLLELKVVFVRPGVDWIVGSVAVSHDNILIQTSGSRIRPNGRYGEYSTYVAALVGREDLPRNSRTTFTFAWRDAYASEQSCKCGGVSVRHLDIVVVVVAHVHATSDDVSLVTEPELISASGKYLVLKHPTRLHVFAAIGFASSLFKLLTLWPLSTLSAAPKPPQLTALAMCWVLKPSCRRERA